MLDELGVGFMNLTRDDYEVHEDVVGILSEDERGDQA